MKNNLGCNIQGMRLDFGGIAKGYIAQKVIDFLKRQKHQQALADASGDIVMSDAPPGNYGGSSVLIA